MADSGVMTTFFYKELTRNPEIGNIPAWVSQYPVTGASIEYQI